MAQFDVYRVRGRGFVIDCQSDLLDTLPTRFVVPLRRKDDSVIHRLTPVFDIEGHAMSMVTQLAGAMDVRDIDNTVMSLVSHEYEIKTALDFLISGF